MSKLVILVSAILIVSMELINPNFTNAIIININAKYNTPSNPITIFFDSGTYNVIPIGINDGGTYNAWSTHYGNYNSWKSGYNISSNEFGSLFIPNIVLGPYYQTASIALNHAVTTSFTLNSKNYVNFYIHDGPGGSWSYDNIGGMSLRVDLSSHSAGTKSVPEPATLFLFVIGLFGFTRIKSKNNSILKYT